MERRTGRASARQGASASSTGPVAQAAGDEVDWRQQANGAPTSQQLAAALLHQPRGHQAPHPHSAPSSAIVRRPPPPRRGHTVRDLAPVSAPTTPAGLHAQSSLPNLATLVTAQWGKQPVMRSRAWLVQNGFLDPVAGRADTFKLLITRKVSWMVGRTAYRGAYGKVHLAQRLASHDAAGDPRATSDEPKLQVAIKEQRLRAKPAGRAGPKTAARSMKQIRAEAQAFVQLRQKIERCASTWARAFADEGIGNLDHVAGKSTPTEVFDFFADGVKPKIYMAMTLEAGNADDIFALLSDAEANGAAPGLAAAVATSFATQTLLELAAMHTAGRMAHLDLKLANITYDGEGRFKLMDFGLVLPLAEDATVTRSGLRAGSLLAPEMVLPPRAASAPTERQRAGAATDVHALCGAVLLLLAGPDVASPFYKPRVSPAAAAAGDVPSGRVGPVDQQEAAAIVEAVERLAAAAALPAVRQRLLDLNQGHDQGQAAELVRHHVGRERPWLATFFLGCLRRAPQLTLLMLSGLRAAPAQRPQALALAQAAMRLLPSAGDPLGPATRQLFAKAPQLQRHREAFATMDRYTALLAAGV